MTSQAIFYVNPDTDGEEPDRQVITEGQAQLIACRLYAAARGYAAAGVHANLAGTHAGWRQAAADALEQVQNAGICAEDPAARAPVLVTYDGRELLSADGQPNPIGKLVAAWGVRVETALPPHALPQVNGYYKPESLHMWHRTMQDLWGIYARPAQGRPQPEPDIEDEPVDPLLFPALLALLEDETALHGLAARRREQTREEQERWQAALAEVRTAEEDAERKRSLLLDLLLEGTVPKSMITARRERLDAEIYRLGRERRRTHAFAAAALLSGEQESQIIEVARRVRPVLEGLTEGEQRRAAYFLQASLSAADEGQAQFFCLLPLVDDSQRGQAQGTAGRQRGKRSGAISEPLAASPEAPAEDYPLVWTVPLGTARAEAARWRAAA